jgi:hypothetical protein
MERMDEPKILRNIKILMVNIYRMNVHLDYAQRHLQIITSELEGFPEQKMWIEYDNKIKELLPQLLELNDDIDWEKEIEKWKPDSM